MCRIRLRERYKENHHNKRTCTDRRLRRIEKKWFLWSTGTGICQDTEIRPRNYIGGYDAKTGREPQCRPTTGAYSLLETSNENGKRLIDFVSSHGLKTRNTDFMRKGTWRAPSGEYTDQIDHVLIEHRREQYISKIRTYRGPNVNTDYLLLNIKLVQQIPRKPEKEKTRRTKIKRNTIEQEKGQINYVKEVTKRYCQSKWWRENASPRRKYNLSYKKRNRRYTNNRSTTYKKYDQECERET